MNYKWLSVILGIICIVLGINFYRLQNYANNLQVPKCGHTLEIDKLEAEKKSWLEREDVFLKQTAELVTQVNELKMQLENNKPLIIYRNVQKIKVDDVASESYTNVLEQRYSPNK